MKRLIVTADDFGIAVPVNQAVELAHRSGILTTASLMVGAAAAADAVARARSLPNLAVGLHVVVVDGHPCLPPEQIPALVGPDGAFLTDLVAAGIRFFFRPGARRQLEAELTAQFEAFRATGLPLDHVNAHNHMHVHPTVLGMILKIGRRYGMTAVRLPAEPADTGGTGRRTPGGMAVAPWMALLRARLRRAGLAFNDYVLGLSATGAVDEACVLSLLETLPEGTGELYFHPATARCPEIDRSMPDYDHQGELAALLSPKVRARLESLGVRRVAFRDLVEPPSPT
ncbi:MAG: ChbG/HpnK family deacetylase [Azospirillum sp.]|nr:ChbG/HpnK family deacetylase [Azospirillum sp.]